MSSEREIRTTSSIRRSSGAGRVPTVSVVIPCYRYGHFLRECVNSVLTQPGVRVDALIVDDASPDGSADVARALAEDDPRIDVVAHHRNTGHIATYNDGLSRVTGEYVVLLSADDMLAPGSLGRAVTLLESDDDIGFVYGFPSSFEVVPPPPFRGRRTSTVWEGQDWLLRSCVRGRGAVYNPEVVMRTDVLRQLGGGYDPRFPHAADMLLWLRAAARYKVGRVNGTTQAYYRVHGQNMHLTDLAGGLRDLRERSQVFRTLFEEDRGAIPHADEMYAAARRSLAREALALAGTSDDHGDAAGFEAYVGFAVDECPDVTATRAWRSCMRRRDGRLTSLERYGAKAEVRVRDAVAWRRWRRTGL